MNFIFPFKLSDYNYKINKVIFQNGTDDMQNELNIAPTDFGIFFWSNKDYKHGVIAVRLNITFTKK